MTKPTTLPRWAILLSHGALIATVIAGVLSYGRSAGRTEAALAQVKELPQLQSSVQSTSAQLSEIKQLIEKQTAKQNETLEAQNKRIDTNQQVNTLAINSLTDKLTTVQGQMGSVWALAQADSNKVSKLEGMLTAMQNQLQHKEK